jgi:hypothetical protein
MSPVGYVRKLGSASVAGGTADSRQYSEKVLLSSPRQLPVSQQSTPGEPHVVPLKRQPVRAQNRPRPGRRHADVLPAARRHFPAVTIRGDRRAGPRRRRAEFGRGAFGVRRAGTRARSERRADRDERALVGDCRVAVLIHVAFAAARARRSAGLGPGTLPTAPTQSVAPQSLVTVTLRVPAGHVCARP